MILLANKTTKIKVFVIAAVTVFGTVAALFQTFQPAKVEASRFGPSPTFTGAPGEANCTACHATNPVNSGEGNVVITGMPANYLPGQVIPLTVTVNDPDGVIFGFELTSIDPKGDKAGGYTFPVATPSILQVETGFVGTSERDYLMHTNNGVTPTQFGTKSWNFNWTAPARRAGKVGVYAAGNAANDNFGTSGDFIYTTSTQSLAGTGISDFDGDRKNEVAVYRPSNGIWYSANSSNGETSSAEWGVPGDVITPGDYDGDGVTDRAIYRPSNGLWYLKQSTAGIYAVAFGMPGDIPVPADYDGDLKTDVAVYRPSNQLWYVLKSTGDVAISHFGASGDIPVPGDYDGDAKADVAVYRPSTGVWYIAQSSDGVAIQAWGVTGDKPIPADYDGDGKTDIAVFRPDNATWYISGSSQGPSITSWGVSSDILVPADYDNDGKTDISVFRPSNGTWYTLRSSDGGVTYESWGMSGDVPVPAGYLPAS